ncbi:hypothetical protein [Streptomyces beigongshangae]|nr:hypothetical protein [Streptomyces sp. REN17]
MAPPAPVAYVSQPATGRVAAVGPERFAVVGGFATGPEPHASVLPPGGGP